MLSRQFQSWAGHASAGERADAAGDLARAYLYAESDTIERGEMARAMTCLLDDPSPLVRRCLAEALAGADHAPHHLLSALINDRAEIAAIVLGRSPVLTDAELIDATAMGEAPAQSAIADRPGLSAAVAGALAEVGTRDAVLVLCRNLAATLADPSARRILQRFGDDGEIRDALAARSDIGAGLRHALVVATAQALCSLATARGWMTPERARRVAAEAGDRAAMEFAPQDPTPLGERDRADFVGSLRDNGHLTPALLLRSLMSGQTALFAAALAELSGQRMSRVMGLIRRPDSLGFTALVRSAGLPDAMLVPVTTALGALRADEAPRPTALRRDIVAAALARCGIDRETSFPGLTALLRRFESEAVREESRGPAPVPALRALPEAGWRLEPCLDAPSILAVAA